MPSPSSNVPDAPANTPVERDEPNAIQPQHDELLDALPSATANRALGDPTIVPPNSPEFGTTDDVPSIVAGIEEMSLGSSRVRNESAYTLHNSAQAGEPATDNTTEKESDEVENGIVRDVAVQPGSELALQEPISPGMSVHLRFRARDIEHLSNSVLTLASALESLTRALNALLNSPEIRAREEEDEESQASTARALEHVAINDDENTVVNHDGDSVNENGNGGNNGGL